VLLENPLCKLLHIRYPIIQAGMAGQTTPELVAAVSNAGGLGILGATRMTPENISEAVRKIKMNTTKPYGVNLWLGPQERKKDQDISSVQQFLNQKFRKPLGLPLKSVSSSPEHDTTDLPPPSKLSGQLQIILQWVIL
jgi:nitronate monooxygenase